MPVGIEPRAALPYSFGIQLAVFEKLGSIEEDVTASLDRLQTWSMDAHEDIHEEARTLADHIAQSIPVIYTTTQFAPVALRARQQQ